MNLADPLSGRLLLAIDHNQASNHNGGQLQIGPDGKLAVFPASGGDGRPIPDVPAGTVPISWTADGRELYVFRIDEFPARIFRVDPGSGAKHLWQTIALSDPAGVHGFPSIRVTPDGKAYAYSYKRFLSELYEASGLK